MIQPASVVFLLDVDNTLLDNDQIEADLKRYLTQTVGDEGQERYWAIFEELRAKLDYADYLGALQRYRVENLHDLHFLQISSYLLDYPLSDRLYPSALEVIKQLSNWGTAVILSDGDGVFQPRKIERSGLFEAVDGRVLIYLHKEQELEDIQKHYPAHHYVLVDDKPDILAAVKKIWGNRLTTVCPRQGHYAHDPKATAVHPAPDITIDAIGDLIQFDLPAMLGATSHAGSLEAAGFNPRPLRRWENEGGHL